MTANDLEARVQQTLDAAARQVPVAPAPDLAVIEAGSRRRRRASHRRFAAASLLAVVAVVAVVSVVVAQRGGTDVDVTGTAAVPPGGPLRLGLALDGAEVVAAADRSTVEAAQASRPEQLPHAPRAAGAVDTSWFLPS